MTDVWTEMMKNRVAFRERTLAAVKERLDGEAAAKKSAGDSKPKAVKETASVEAPVKTKAESKKEKAVEAEVVTDASAVEAPVADAPAES